jgi:hypothetical protein
MECYCPHGSFFDLISTDSNGKYVFDTLSGQALFFAKKISTKVELLLQHCFALSCMISFVGKISALPPAASFIDQKGRIKGVTMLKQRSKNTKQPKKLIRSR